MPTSQDAVMNSQVFCPDPPRQGPKTLYPSFKVWGQVPSETEVPIQCSHQKLCTADLGVRQPRPFLTV